MFKPGQIVIYRYFDRDRHGAARRKGRTRVVIGDVGHRRIVVIDCLMEVHHGSEREWYVETRTDS